MKIGADQYNTFDTMTMDCWNDRVYYEGKEFPAGHFATEILNFAGVIHDPLLERITVLTALVDDLSTAEKSKRHDIAAQLKPLLHDTVSWLYTCPPFCYCESQSAYEDLEHALSEERLDRDYEEEEAHLPYLALSFCEPILRILAAIYNFCLLIRAFEMKYLRRSKRRNADAFAKAAHECFDEDDSFLILLEQMPFGEVEEFFSYPRVITGFKYFHDENNEEKWKTAQRVICKRAVDFYVFDLMNGLHHGHAPSQCQGCGRYFLTTNGHIPKYCDGVAPQDSRYTCRQYGAMMHQKEQNKQHPVYRLFNTRKCRGSFASACSNRWASSMVGMNCSRCREAGRSIIRAGFFWMISLRLASLSTAETTVRYFCAVFSCTGFLQYVRLRSSSIMFSSVMGRRLFSLIAPMYGQT